MGPPPPPPHTTTTLHPPSPPPPAPSNTTHHSPPTMATVAATPNLKPSTLDTCINTREKSKKIIASHKLLLLQPNQPRAGGEVTPSYHSSHQPGLVIHFISFCFDVATQKIYQ